MIPNAPAASQTSDPAHSARDVTDSRDMPAEQGPVERELVRLLRELDVNDLQPGAQERCWQQFKALAELPDSVVPAPPTPLTPVESDDAPAHEARRRGPRLTPSSLLAWARA